MVPFVIDGLTGGEPVMVAARPEQIGWLQRALSEQADEVLFVDLTVMDRYPSHLIAAWQRFLDGRPWPPTCLNCRGSPGRSS